MAVQRGRERRGETERGRVMAPVGRQDNSTQIKEKLATEREQCVLGAARGGSSDERTPGRHHPLLQSVSLIHSFSPSSSSPPPSLSLALCLPLFSHLPLPLLNTAPLACMIMAWLAGKLLDCGVGMKEESWPCLPVPLSLLRLRIHSTKH